MLEGQQGSADGDAVNSGASFADVVEGNDVGPRYLAGEGTCPYMINIRSNPGLEEPRYVASAVQDGNDLHQRRPPVHDHVLR